MAFARGVVQRRALSRGQRVTTAFRQQREQQRDRGRVFAAGGRRVQRRPELFVGEAQSFGGRARQQGLDGVAVFGVRAGRGVDDGPGKEQKRVE